MPGSYGALPEFICWTLQANPEIAVTSSPVQPVGKRRVVVLAGAAGRMGQAVARRLSQEGYDLALVDRDEGALLKFAQSLEGKTSCILADLSKPESAESILT